MNEYISLCRRYYKFEFIIKKMQSEAIIKKKKKSGIEYLGLSETEGGASVTGWATHQQRDVCCCWRRDWKRVFESMNEWNPRWFGFA